jgi:hypothetical protein
VRVVTLFVVVDALRPDYVTAEDMPVLHRLAQEGVSGSIVPPFAFEPDAAFFTGRYPAEYGGGVHFQLGSNGKSWGPLQGCLLGLDLLPASIQRPLRIAARTVQRISAPTDRLRRESTTACIPFAKLRRFRPTSTLYPWEPGFCGSIKTIFDLLRSAGKRFFVHAFPAWPCRADMVADRVRHELPANIDFAYLFISDLDGIGHRYGPGSDQRRAAARHVDAHLNEILQHFRGTFDAVNMLIVGDHGMVEVARSIDMRRLLSRLKVEERQDVVCFLDSTLARFWCKNGEAAAEIRERLSGVDGGRVLDECDIRDYGISIPSNALGDVVFWTDEGVVIAPNYWSVGAPPRGMHGYRKEVAANHAALILHTRGGEATLAPGLADAQQVYRQLDNWLFKAA